MTHDLNIFMSGINGNKWVDKAQKQKHIMACVITLLNHNDLPQLVKTQIPINRFTACKQSMLTAVQLDCEKGKVFLPFSHS